MQTGSQLASYTFYLTRIGIRGPLCFSYQLMLFVYWKYETFYSMYWKWFHQAVTKKIYIIILLFPLPVRCWIKDVTYSSIYSTNAFTLCLIKKIALDKQILMKCISLVISLPIWVFKLIGGLSIKLNFMQILCLLSLCMKI